MLEAAVPPPRILILDDEAPLMELLCEKLQANGYATTGFTSPAEALAALRTTKFDLILTDLSLPEMDGIALLRAALEIDCDIGGIIITGGGTIATAVEAIQAGALDYILKPFQLSIILPVLTRALAARRLRLENLELKHQIRERNAQLEFFSIVSHELRTPLNAVNGWVRLLRGGLLAPEKMAHALDVIERNVNSQIEITESLLDISRIITGKLKLVMSPASMATIVDAAVETARPAANVKNVQINTSLDRAADPVAADSDRLQQVVWNLLSNAIKFTPQSGSVEVSLKQTADGAIETTVSDTGQGISADFLPHIFDHFRQQDGSSTRTHGGLGLGLSIVRHLVELHGGTVTASSGGEGKGSAFTVRLPAIRAEGLK